MVRIGIVSTAHMHAASYARCVNEISEADLQGVYDENTKRGESAANQWECQFFPDLQQMLKVVDAVIICSENNKHKAYTIQAARAHKDILCEKPIATNVVDAKEMIRVCDEAEVRLQIAFPCRFSTPAMRVKELLREGTIGEVVAISGTNHGQMPGGWFVHRETAGGGAVMDHTVHVADLIRWYLQREFTSVYAEVDTRLYDVPIDDCGMLVMEMEGGVFVTQDPSWSRPRTFPTWGDVTLEIIGTRGRLSLDIFAQAITHFDDANRKVVADAWADDMDMGLIKDFVAMVKTGGSPSVTGYDGLQAMAVALAAYESAQRNEPVTVDC